MHAWQARLARRIGSRGRIVQRLRIACATNTLKAAANQLKSAPVVEATTAELAARQRADSAMLALLAEVS